ncbi:uncharacterized protein LOC18446005 isoform X2 [Amborella trichopoda]|uniref:uncharacterized protein LOC18446005 isoform X2 n=2 Tax=Amborella trichopoda TaxID=13333 RepID=UPI0009BCA063|nr:uncharacterized protein LOC18446005 isoform X2 [Amborella trichopoda]|eukprot:XP_020530363.1 uncharacterized protein LOC18446005 isoform X2 [Amborella trichopoda]
MRASSAPPCYAPPLQNPSSWNKNKTPPICHFTPKINGKSANVRSQSISVRTSTKCSLMPIASFDSGAMHITKSSRSSRKPLVFYLPNQKDGTGVIDPVAIEDVETKLESENIPIMGIVAKRENFNYREPFNGKPGSVSFCGLTYQHVEERQLISSPFKEGTGSFLWILGPVVLISSLVLPQFYIGNFVESVLQDEILSGIITTLCSEVMFYIGLATFLVITDHVQRPYLQFSSKRWSLITGLRGYLHSAFLSMGFKVFAPTMALYVMWPVLRVASLVAMGPFLLGCMAQLAFEIYLSRKQSSSWPLVPIIFEVYRLFQLSKAALFIEKIMFLMRGSAMSPVMLERRGALIATLVVLQLLGIVCLWSLTTFLLRLFPSRPVAENY